jgi:hypothetical protein
MHDEWRAFVLANTITSFDSCETLGQENKLKKRKRNDSVNAVHLLFYYGVP